MNIMNVICLALALAGMSITAVAAPRWQVDPAQLPPGLTKEKAVAMLEEIDRKTEKELADEEAAQQRKAERVQRAAKKYEERLARAVDKDPELKALKEKLEAGMKALDNTELSDKERTERLNRMASDMKVLRARGLANAGINVSAMNNEIRQSLGDGVKPRGDQAGSEEVLQEEDGAFYYNVPEDDELPPASAVTTRGTTTKYLKEPWPNAEQRTQVGSYGGGVNKEAGTYGPYARAYLAGYGTNRRGLAHFQTVPTGVTKIRVTAQLPETFFNNIAVGVLFGGAQARSSSRIEVWDGSSRRICRRSRLHADLWGLVAAVFSQQGIDNVVLDCEFDAPAAGRDIVIKFVSDAFVQAWGAGSALTYVNAKPADVRIDLISPTTARKLYYR